MILAVGTELVSDRYVAIRCPASQGEAQRSRPHQDAQQPSCRPWLAVWQERQVVTQHIDCDGEQH